MCPDAFHLDMDILIWTVKITASNSVGFTYNALTGTDSLSIETGNNTSYQLDLNVFRSGIDPNFAVLSFRASYFIFN